MAPHSSHTNPNVALESWNDLNILGQRQTHLASVTEVTV